MPPPLASCRWARNSCFEERRHDAQFPTSAKSPETFAYANRPHTAARLPCGNLSVLLAGHFSLTAPNIHIDFPSPLAAHAHAQSPDPSDADCPRSTPGLVVAPPPDLYSQNGTLEVSFAFQTAVDEQGLARYCFIANGTPVLEAPTLHVNPGDQLIIHFQNALPPVSPSSEPSEAKRAGGRVRTISRPLCKFPSTTDVVRASNSKAVVPMTAPATGSLRLRQPTCIFMAPTWHRRVARTMSADQESSGGP